MQFIRRNKSELSIILLMVICLVINAISIVHGLSLWIGLPLEAVEVICIIMNIIIIV